MLDDLMLVRKALTESGANLIIARRGEILFMGWSKGLRDLANIALGNPDMLDGSSVADRIIGKAAAMIYSVNNVKAIYALTLSRHALEELKGSGIKIYYERLVPYIEAPGGEVCPFEKLVLEFSDRDEAYRRLLERFRKLGWG